MKPNLAQISEKKNGWGEHPFYLKFWVNRLPLEQNRRF